MKKKLFAIILCAAMSASAFTGCGAKDTVEKAAEILVKVMSMTDRKRQTIEPDDFRALNEPFGVNISEDFLYEKKNRTIGEY